MIPQKLSKNSREKISQICPIMIAMIQPQAKFSASSVEEIKSVLVSQPKHQLR